MCLNCSVIGWYARLDVVHSLCLFAFRRRFPSPSPSPSPSLFALCRRLCPFALVSSFHSPPPGELATLLSTVAKSLISRQSETIERSPTELEDRRSVGKRAWKRLTGCPLSYLDLFSDQTPGWLATIRDTDRYSCVRRKNGDEKRAPSKWRVVHAFRSIVGYEFRSVAAAGAPC